jgi:hypothetical protein
MSIEHAITVAEHMLLVLKRMAMTATDYIYRRMLNPMPKPVRFVALKAPKGGAAR